MDAVSSGEFGSCRRAGTRPGITASTPSNVPGVGSPIAALEVVVLFDRLVDPEVGLCANDSRFGEAQVVEAVAAWGAGRLTVVDITDLARRFLESRRVVRLITTDPSGRAPGQWSTLTHRAVEDRVLDQLAPPRETSRPPVAGNGRRRGHRQHPNPGRRPKRGRPHLGANGPALRALIAPAGHGKTTTLATAVDAVRRSGRAVLALSTTNQAVDQLRQVGIPAVTVARFTLDGAPLEPGSVVIVDECSQLPTHEANAVLAAVAACAGGQMWMVGDPLQAQPVRAGGLAPWLAAEIDVRRVVAAQLTENRRQADPIEREALTAFRDGKVETSQELRESQGWEHHHRSGEEAVAAMAAAVLTDMEAYGAEHIAALAVTTPTAKHWPIASGPTSPNRTGSADRPSKGPDGAAPAATRPKHRTMFRLC